MPTTTHQFAIFAFVERGIKMANEDKSKGKKEPTGSKKEKDQKVAELVLSLGVDGGGASIYRTPLASGGYRTAVRCLVENTVRKFSDERSKTWKDHYRKK
jgi:hypothetical protein